MNTCYESYALDAPVPPELLEIFDADRAAAAALHADLAKIALPEYCKILMVETAPTFPLQDPKFAQLPEQLQTLTWETHIGQVPEQNDKDARPLGLSVDTFAYALGLKPRDDDHTKLWNLANEDPHAPWAWYKDAPFNLETTSDYSGLVVSGSSWMVSEIQKAGMIGPDMSRNIRLTDLVRRWRLSEAYRANIGRTETPSFWVCYGHQVLTEIMMGLTEGQTGAVDKLLGEDGNPTREFGMSIVELTDEARQDALLAGLGNTAVLAATRTQCVQKLPQGAKILGANELDAHQIIDWTTASGIRGARGFQGHPELWRVMLYVLARFRREPLREGNFDFKGFTANLLNADSDLLVKTKRTIFGNFRKLVAESNTGGKDC